MRADNPSYRRDSGPTPVWSSVVASAVAGPWGVHQPPGLTGERDMVVRLNAELGNLRRRIDTLLNTHRRAHGHPVRDEVADYLFETPLLLADWIAGHANPTAAGQVVLMAFEWFQVEPGALGAPEDWVSLTSHVYIVRHAVETVALGAAGRPARRERLIRPASLVATSRIRFLLDRIHPPASSGLDRLANGFVRDRSVASLANEMAADAYREGIAAA